MKCKEEAVLRLLCDLRSARGRQFVNSKFLTEAGFARREAWQGQAEGAGTRQALLAWLPTRLGAADGPQTWHILFQTWGPVFSLVSVCGEQKLPALFPL